MPGLVESQAIVTAAEVAAITHEAGLANFDDAASGATLANALAQATNFLIVDLRARFGPDFETSKIHNTSDLKLAAAYKVKEIVFGSQPQGDAECTKKAADGARDYAAQVAKYVFISTDATTKRRGGRALPRSVHLDREPYLARPVDNTNPGSDLGPYYRSR